MLHVARLQVIGCNKKVPQLLELCQSGRSLGQLTDAQTALLFDDQSMMRLGYSLDVLVRLRLIAGLVVTSEGHTAKPTPAEHVVGIVRLVGLSFPSACIGSTESRQPHTLPGLTESQLMSGGDGVGGCMLLANSLVAGRPQLIVRTAIHAHDHQVCVGVPHICKPPVRCRCGLCVAIGCVLCQGFRCT